MGVPAIIRWDQAYNRNGDSKLPRAAVNAIRTYMNNDTLTGWVKAETLAGDIGMTVRGVRKQIAANVAAGWLEIAESGNSSKATVYRLTYPGDREPQFTVPDAVRVNHSSRSTPEGCPTVHGKGEPQFTPTSPRTSPKRSSLLLLETVNPGSPFGEPDLTDRVDQDETGLRSRSLAIAGSEATEGPSSDPFADRGERHDAREGRAAGLAIATDGVDWSQYEAPIGDRDTSAKGRRIQAHVPPLRS